MNRDQAIEAMRGVLQREFGGFLAHDPYDPERFWTSAAAAVLDAVGWRPESEIAAETLHAAANALTDDAVRWGASPRRDRYSTAAWLIDRAAALAGEA